MENGVNDQVFLVFHICYVCMHVHGASQIGTNIYIFNGSVHQCPRRIWGPGVAWLATNTLMPACMHVGGEISIDLGSFVLASISKAKL